MTKAIYVQKAMKDCPDHGIKKGEGYWWWKFNFGRKQYSKTQPTKYDLTRSEFQKQIYTIQDMIDALCDISPDVIEGEVQNILSEIENLKSECEEKLSNMPENLQESSPSGQILQERIDNLDSWYSDIENVDLSPIEDVEVDETELGEGQTKEEKLEELKAEALESIIDEIQCCGGNF